MDLNESADMSKSPHISFGRETGPSENSFQEIHQGFYSMDCNINRMHIESEFLHIENDEMPPLNGNLVHAQSSSLSRQAKRQNFWGSTSRVHNDEAPGAYASDRPETVLDGSYYGSRSGSHSFDLLHTGNNVASSSNCSSHIQPNVIHTGTKTRHSNVEGSLNLNSQGRLRAELSATVEDCQIGRNFISNSGRNARENEKGKSLVHLNTDADIPDGNLGYPHRCMFGNLESGRDEEISSFHLGFDDTSNDNSEHLRENLPFGDIRGTYKRKISTVDYTEASRFDPQIFRRSDNLTEKTEAAEPSRLDWARFANCNSVNNSSQFDVSIAESSEGTYLRSNTSVPQESNETPFHLLCASRDSRLIQPDSTQRRSEASCVDNERSLNAQASVDHWPASLGLMSSTTPIMSGWGTNSSSSRRGNSAFSTFGVNERGVSGTTWDEMFGRDPEMENRYSAARNVNIGIQYNSNSSSPESTSIEMNPPRRSSEGGHTRNGYISLGSSTSSSMPFSRSSGHRSSRNSGVPPATTLINPQRPMGLPFDGNSAVRRGLRNSSLLSARARREALFAGVPYRGLNVLRADGEYRRQFLSEILSAMHNAFRSEYLNIEEFVVMDPSLLYAEIEHDEHSDMRLDVDNMSYEELLALEERIGDVPTGLTEQTISLCLRERKYSSLDATIAAISQESDNKCCICQDEFVEEDELGMLECGHGYHSDCIKQWLVQKNSCPICKNPAYTK